MMSRAVAMAREAERLSFVDAVHFAPHELIDVNKWGCDFLVCSAYKFYGPHLGVLFARREQIESLDLPKLQPAPESAPERLETGTQNHEGIVCAAAAVDFLVSLAMAVDGTAGFDRRTQLRSVFKALHERGSILLDQLWDGLIDLDNVKLFGLSPAALRTPTLAFTVKDKPADQVCQRLAKRGIFASHGDFYATTVARRLCVGDAGFVRIGCACYTTSDEIARVVEAVRTIASCDE